VISGALVSVIIEIESAESAILLSKCFVKIPLKDDYERH